MNTAARYNRFINVTQQKELVTPVGEELKRLDAQELWMGMENTWPLWEMIWWVLLFLNLHVFIR